MLHFCVGTFRVTDDRMKLLIFFSRLEFLRNENSFQGMMIKKKKIIAGSMDFGRNTNAGSRPAFLLQPTQLTFRARTLCFEDQEQEPREREGRQPAWALAPLRLCARCERALRWDCPYDTRKVVSSELPKSSPERRVHTGNS